ncbi:Ig-like domain-containing protein, partial [Marmoricola sp. RAF53]|uniref:Ig-like domain-containing protein n=1 Tax=Marmoricola sp. RAF53 TaxID=3233059 RepID=UPI003F984E5D
MTARPARSWTAPTRALYVSVASVVLAALMVVLPTSPALAANIDTVANTAFVNELGCTDASLTRITSMGGTGSTLPADTNAAGLVNGNATQNGPVSTIGQTFTLGDGGDGYPDTDEATLTVVHGDQVTKGNNQEWTGITGIPQSGTATSPPVVNRRTWTGAASGDGVNRLTGAWLQFGRAASYDDSQTVPGGVDTRGFKTLKITLPHAAKLQFNITGIDDDTGVRVQMSNGGTVVQHTAKAYAGSTFQELTQAAAGNSWISTIRGVTDQYWRENVDNRQTASYTSAGAVDTIIIGGSFQGSAGAPASNVAISDIWGCQALDAVKAGSVSGTPVAQDAFGTTYRTTTTVKVGNTGAAGALRVYGPQVSDNLANAFGSGSGAPTGTISNVSVTGVASDTSSPSNVAACTANAGYTGTGTNTLLTGSSTDYLDAGQSCTITISADVRFANPHGAIAKTNQAATTSTGGNATKESSTNGNALPATDKGDTASTTPYAFPSVLAPAAPVISTPVNGSTVTASSQVVSGTGIAGNTVTVKEGGTTICTTTVTVAGTWTCPASLFPNGAHTISATQTNPIGLESGASTSTFTVNAPLPVAPVIMTPAEGSTTNDAKPAITGTGTPGDTVTVKEGATTVCTATVQPDGSWSCAPTTPLSDGGHTVTATQKDPAGNTGPSDSQSFTVDATAPAAPLITGPAEGSVVNTTKPTITGTGEAGATVKVTDGSGATVCTALVQAGGTWSCIPSSPLPDGPQTLTATQIDPAGNTSAPVNVTFTVDTTAPDAPVIEGPVEGAVVNTATPSITGTGEDGATVTVTDAGGNVVCSTKVKGDGTWSCDPTAGLPEGQQTLTATQTDPSGNTSVPDQVTFTVDSGAPSPPVIEGPAEGAVVNTTKPTISGTGEADAKVTVTDAGGNVVCSATVQLDGTWSCDATTALPAGEQTLTATQTDPSGHTSAPDTVTFTVDTTVPAAPQITGPAEGAVVNTTKPTITGTGEADAKVTVTDAGGNIVCTATVQGDGTWACAPTTALPQGPQT